MTHDELLARIDYMKFEVGDSGINEESTAIQALRAVVELHKPQEITLPDGEWGANCSHCDFAFNYPCPTIQVIEKELR